MPLPAPSLSPAQEQSLLNGILSGTPLPALANSLSLTFLDILNLIASPPIQSQLITYERSMAHIVRTSAAPHIAKVIDALSQVIDAHRQDAASLKHHTNPDSIRLRNSILINTRRAAAVLLRAANFAPLDPNATTRPSPRAPVRSPLPQPEGLTVSSRGSSESSSATPGPSPVKTPRPERVLVPTLPLPSPRTSIKPHPRSPISHLLHRAGAATLTAGPAP